MRTILFEPFSGAAGDMILGSLIGLGADGGRIMSALESAYGVTLNVATVTKRGIQAVDVQVHSHRENQARPYAVLLETIKKASLPDKVRENVLEIFAILAEAEAKVHGEPPEKLHFHEVGQDDALADVTGTCLALSELAADAVFCTPINVGGGQVHAAHGILPVPAPATLEILTRFGLPFYGNGNRELLTPTGAAILAHFARPLSSLPLGKALATGYGAGDAETEQPNVLRSLLMDIETGCGGDRVDILETNLDDVPGEILGNLFDRLMGMGARDVSVSPLTMKKGRPGHLVRVVTSPEMSSALALEIMRETGSLGIRVLPAVHRFTAERRMASVPLSAGNEKVEIRVKFAFDQRGDILNVSPEYEDCRAIAERAGLPLREVMRRAQEEAWRIFGSPWTS